MQSEVSSAQQLGTVVDPAPEKHPCLDCGVDISHRRRDAQRCERCSKLRNRQRAKDHYRANRARKLEYTKRRQQTPEYKQSRQEWKEKNPEKILAYRQRKKQKHREKTGYNPEGRICEKCGTDISDRGHRAKWCKSCSTPPARKCIVCDNDIGKRGPSRFCSEDCKQRHQQSKELQGYTKTCTKCNETKEHTEFGLHYGLRRSVCKSCEVKEQSERYHNFTPQQRRRRLRLRREREQIKRTIQSSAERAMETIKRRKAHRQKFYGPDFDEDRLYSEQQGRCAICGTPQSLDEMELDHDHETMKLRGFLCKNCNFKLVPRYENFPQQHQDSPHLNLYLLQGRQQ